MTNRINRKKCKVVLIAALLVSFIPLVLAIIAAELIPAEILKRPTEYENALLSRILFDLDMLWFFFSHLVFPITTAFAAVVIILLIYGYPPLLHESVQRKPYTSLVVPLVANVYVALQPLIFLACPYGLAIRPMGWTYLIFIAAIVAMISGLIWAISSAIRNHRTLYGALGCILSLTLWPVLFFSFLLVVITRGLVLSS